MHKFSPRNVERLENNDRLEYLKPPVIFNFADLLSAFEITDFGAGSGFFSRLILQENPACRLNCLDISYEMLQFLQSSLTDTQRERVSCHLSQEASLSLKDSSQDLIFAINVLHELAHPRKIFEEFNRVLKPGGRVVIIDWKKCIRPFGPPAEECLTVEFAETLLKETGFEGIESSSSLQYHFMVKGEKLRYSQL